MDIILLIGFIFLLLFVYGIFSNKLDSYSISGPMIFTTFGVIFNSFGLNDQLHIGSESLELIGQIALIAILFTDASNIKIKDFYKLYKLPIRLLLIGLPITMFVGTAAAPLLFPGFDLVLLAMMAFILSPTDAALGQAVVQSIKVPVKIREAINVESGLNDGLVLPPILICIALFLGESSQFEDNNVYFYVFKQIFFALFAGVLLGWGGSKLINWSVRNNYANHLFQGISVIAISIISYAAAEHIGGNGYIAAFVSGLYFNADSKKLQNYGQEFGEFLSQPLSLFVFFIFGAIILPYFYQVFTIEILVYALLSLTLFRMIPVVLTLSGSGLTFKEKLFVSWFGPRGIASILYLLLAYKVLPKNAQNETIYATIVLTVTLSIYIHGISAVPLSNSMNKKAAKA